MTSPIPSKFHSFFWDTNPKTINLTKHKQYIIARLLDQGNWQSAQWVQSQFTPQDIKQTLLEVKHLSPPTVYFWANYLSFSPSSAACLQTPYRQQRSKHWQN